MHPNSIFLSVDVLRN